METSATETSIAPPTPAMLPSEASARGRSDENVRISVRTFLARVFPNRLPVERRADGRYPYPFLMRLTPVVSDDAISEVSSLVVVGKDLSERGFGFFHQHPLPFRRVIATLRDHTGRGFSILVDVSWCRFTSHGWYESGGRFLRVVEAHDAEIKRTA